MKVLIPMAGTGNRFLQAGYTDPKPLIKVNKKRIIEYILEMFDHEDEIIFICNSTHLRDTNMKSILSSLRPDCKIFEIEKMWGLGTPEDLKGYLDERKNITL